MIRSIAVITLAVVSLGSYAGATTTNDAVLGDRDSFECDAFSRDAKVACLPGVRSNYNDRSSFAKNIVIRANEVVECSQVASYREDVVVTCDARYGVGGGGGYLPPVEPVIPVIERAAFTYPDFECLKNLPSVREADDMVSNGFFRSNRVVDRCDSAREKSELRKLERRGFTCSIDATSRRTESEPACVEDLLSKIQQKHTIKGSHKRLLRDNYCGTRKYKCVK